MSAAEHLADSERIAKEDMGYPWTAGPAAHGDPTNGPDHMAVVDRNGITVAELDYCQEGADMADFIAAARTRWPLETAALKAILRACDDCDDTVVTEADGGHVPTYLIRSIIERELGVTGG